MKSIIRRIFTAAVSIFFIALAVSLFSVGEPARAQERAVSSRPSPEIPLSSRYSAPPPAGNLAAVPSEASVKANVRGLMEQRMHGTYSLIADPGLIVNGAKEDYFLRVVDYAGDRGGDLPAAQSDCVITGRVTSARAVVSRDQTYVYSDFEITVESVLKQDTAQPLSDGGAIVTFRTGGAIHFPSGHVTDYLVLDEGFPAVGGRYLLFLAHWPEQVGRYHIETAYQFKDALTYPLDLHPGPNNGATAERFAKYEKMKEDLFLAEAERAVSKQRATADQR